MDRRTRREPAERVAHHLGGAVTRPRSGLVERGARLLNGVAGQWPLYAVEPTGEALSSLRGPVLQKTPSSGNLARDVDVELNPSAYYFANGPCTFDWTTDGALSSTHALRIDSDTNALCRWFTRPLLIKIDAGARYTVSAWSQAQDVRGNGRLGLNFWTNAREYIAPTIVSNRTVKGSQSWTKLEAQATAPPDAAYLRVEFRLNGPGRLWVDDLSVNR